MLKIASYNIWLGKAYNAAGELAEQEGLDILCLQECKENQLAEELGGLTLAGSARLGQVALAMYYNPAKLRLMDISSHRLPPVMYERGSTKERTRLQIARYSLVSSGQQLTIGNLHLANLTASNRGRRQQLRQALRATNSERADAPALVLGDMNYPFFERGIHEVAVQESFTEVGKETTGRTHTSRLTRGRFDRVLATEGIEPVSHEILPISVSDHAAVIVKTVL